MNEIRGWDLHIVISMNGASNDVHFDVGCILTQNHEIHGL